MAGYTRNDTGNNIADGNIINASDLDGEFDAVEAAFNASTGHTHDGTSAEGAPIEKVGPVQDLVITATEVKPKTDNTLDLGTSLLEFKDLYLDGTAYIDGLGENMLVATDKAIQFRDSALSINSSADGQLDIDADTEVEITTTTLDINAAVSLVGHDMSFGDNDKAIFGAGSDLQIYHTGSTSLIIDTGTGNLSIGGSNEVNIVNTANDEFKARFITDGEVLLYYNNSQKFSTTNTGIDVTGTVTADGSITVSDGTTAQLILDDTGQTDDWSIKAQSNYVGHFYGSKLYQEFTNNGDVAFYEDTGTTPRLFWDASAESLGIGTTSPSSSLSIFGTTGSTHGITLQASGWPYFGRLGINGASGGDQYWSANYSFATSAVDSASYYSTFIRNSAAQGIVTFGTSSAVNTAPAERMRIDSSGNVGINTNTAKLQWTSANNKVALEGNSGAMVFYSGASNYYERMRIDASGNLLVGTTDDASTRLNATSGGGTVLQSTSYSVFSRELTSSTQAIMTINNTGVDGKFINCFKDGSAVGSIGTYGSSVVIGGGDCGVRFIDATNAIAPANVSGNTDIDNSIDLGYSTRRFKNLYLSGGVYLGGTGASNLLDDYEEGTWTPTMPNGGSFTIISTGYRKIGNFVMAQAYLASISSIPNNSDDFEIGGLPFTSSAAGGYGGGNVTYVGAADITIWSNPLVNQNDNYLYFHRHDGNSNDILNSNATVLNGNAFIFQVFYATDS